MADGDCSIVLGPATSHPRSGSARGFTVLCTGYCTILGGRDRGGQGQGYSTFNKFNFYCFIFTHDICSTVLPLLIATDSGDSILLSAFIVALTTFTGFVDP